MSEIQGPVHLVGIGGMHMSAIAQLLLQRGVAVTGSDLRLSELTEKVERMGAKVFEGHKAENLGDPALVVYTAAAAEDNPEIAEARKRGIPVILRAEMVARLMQGKRVIAVAGAHGKTTTSSLIAFILSEAGRQQPMYLLGGESIDLGGNAAWGEGDVCVVEADEYRRAFHEYTPEVAVITNVEPDHLDYYGTAEAYHEAFVEFARKVRPGGLLLVCGEDAGAMAVEQAIRGATFAVETYGLNPRAHWYAGNPYLGGDLATFDVVRQGKDLGDIEAHVPGMHFVLNSLAAAAVCLHLGVEFKDIRAAVKKFKGARRRFEMIGEEGGVLVMDDYAHHPTEVRATLETARRRFGGRRIIGVYQPHTYSRIAYLWDEWVSCWSGLDALIVLETYAAREKPEAGRSAEDLARAIREPAASYARDFDTAAQMAVAAAEAGDVIMTIGAGDVVEVGPKVLERLKR